MARNTTSLEDQEFANFLFSEVVTEADLGMVTQYVANTIDPEDVYDEDVLIQWARGKDPEDIYGGDVLSEWAFQNGYVEAF